jgi:hypothetical protein
MHVSSWIQKKKKERKKERNMLERRVIYLQISNGRMKTE